MSREVINRMSAEFGKQIADLSMKLADARVIGSLKDDTINQLQSEVERLTEELKAATVKQEPIEPGPAAVLPPTRKPRKQRKK